jgi:3-oxo-5-alpha-steroid 4-dehydrogenase 3
MRSWWGKFIGLGINIAGVRCKDWLRDAQSTELFFPMLNKRTMAYLAIDPAQLCRAFFILVTAASIGASVIPTLRQLVSYGPRAVPISEIAIPPKDVKSKNLTVWDRLVGLQVPHTWFTHFYIVSVASSTFWAYQLATDGVVFRLLAPRYASDEQMGMTINQIIIAWALMAFQGSRRLYESIRLLKPSTAQMPMASYALGIAFYLAVGVSVWAEGMRKSSSASIFTIVVADRRSYHITQQSLC